MKRSPSRRAAERKWLRAALCAAALAIASEAGAQQVPLGSGSVVETITHLKAGQFVWAPEVAPEGPMLLIVNVHTQRALLYRNGVPIGATTVSTGRSGHETPTGVFSILQKQVEHYSSKYDNAPMPFMQRLTWQGVALHAGQLPGYPASHGCIRLPRDFARLLYGATSLGMTVVIADSPVTPRLASSPEIENLPAGATDSNAPDWHPERSPAGPVSIIVSSRDNKAIVLRNGVVIGSAAVTVDGGVAGTWVYAFRALGKDGPHWIRMALSGATEEAQVPRDEWRRFQAPDAFRKDVAAIVQPGTTVIVTADSLNSATPPLPVRVMESDTGHR